MDYPLQPHERLRAQLDWHNSGSWGHCPQPHFFDLLCHVFRCRLYFLMRECVKGLINGVVECLPEVEIELHLAGKLLAKKSTDAFGDFRFDGLRANADIYTVCIRRAGHDLLEINARPARKLRIRPPRLSRQ